MSRSSGRPSKRTSFLMHLARYTMLLATAAAVFYCVLSARSAFLNVLAVVDRSTNWQTTFRHEVADKIALIVLVVLAFGYIVNAEFSYGRRESFVKLIGAFSRHVGVLIFVLFLSHLATGVAARRAVGAAGVFVLVVEAAVALALLVISFLPRLRGR